MKEQKKKGLSQEANWIGLSMILYAILSLLVPLAARFLFQVTIPNTTWKNLSNVPEWILGIYNLILPFLVLLPTFLLLKKSPKRMQPAIPMGKSEISVLVLLPIFLGVVVLINAISSVVVGLFSERTLATFPTTGVSILLYFFYVCIVPPILEELLFRGMLQGMLRRFGAWFGIVITSVIFTLFHNNVSSMLQVFLLSVVLCYCREITNSISACIVLHFANNLLNFLTLWGQNGLYGVGAVAFGFLLIFFIIILFFAGTWAVKYFGLLPKFKFKKSAQKSIATGKEILTLLSSPFFLIGVLLLVGRIVLNVIFK